ncbi:hypothetical protein RIF29_38525 [Crotalaria pallida]|uniref:Uncharacterized protein n=1 Tax=Crotalaria pallida TaxID=3830 RepID=A0AAN9E4W1_CROPI
MVNEAVPDCVTWQGALDGVYTAKSGYTWMLDLDDAEKGFKDFGIRFITAIWWIWRARCDECIKLQDTTTQTVIHRASMMAVDIGRCYGVSAANVKQARWLSWVIPSLNVTVLNVDGSSLGNPGNAGAVCCGINMVSGSVVLRVTMAFLITFIWSF